MSEQATVTAAEIARLAGVGRAAVSNWRRRYADFPQPVGGPPNSPAFDLAQVESWLRTQGKLRSVPSEDRIWHELDAVSGLSLPDAVVLVGAFLRHLGERGPEAWSALADRPDRTVATRLTAPLRRLVQDLPGARTMPEPLTSQHVSLLRAVADTAAERGAAATFDYFLDRYQDTVSRREFVTPPELADLMVSLAGAGARAGTRLGTVLDPACGTGTLLAAAARRVPDAELLGQDVNPESGALAARRLALAGAPARVVDGDTLLDDAFPELAADAVLCDPPFAVRNWGYEELTYDPRWEYGTPPRGESELAWVQHCLARARPGGTVVVVMPATTASRASGRRLRAQLLRRGALRAVVGLPAGTLAYTAVPVHLWLLRRLGGEPTPGQVLLVDAAADQGPGRSRAVDWKRIEDVVLDAWRRFQRSPESVDEPGVAGAVPLIDLLDEEVDLTPSRRLVPAATDAAGPRFAEVASALSGLLAEIPELLPDLTAVAEAGARTTSSVAELAKLGALTLHSGTTRRIGGSGEGAEPVLTAQDVITGRGPSGSMSREGVSSMVRIAPGDVVVPIAARTIAPAVMTEGGAMLGPHLYLVRPDPEVFDPWFLAGFLRTPENLRHAASLGSVHRIDIRRARVPRLPLSEQQRYAEVFRRLSTLERSLGRAAELGRDLGRIAAEGLAAGVLRPAR